MREIAKVRVRYGYRKIWVLLNRKGWNVSRYLAYRLDCEEGLAYGHAAVIGTERRLNAGNDFVPRLRIRSGASILWPIS